MYTFIYNVHFWVHKNRKWTEEVFESDIEVSGAANHKDELIPLQNTVYE